MSPLHEVRRLLRTLLVAPVLELTLLVASPRPIVFQCATCTSPSAPKQCGVLNLSRIPHVMYFARFP